MKLAPLPPDRLAGLEPAASRAAERRGLAVLLIIAAILLVLVASVAMNVGKAPLPFRLPWDLLGTAGSGSSSPDLPASARTILLDIRLPRVILAGLVGAALAIAGATYQGLFRNDLADPYLLGVASGAALGAVVAFVLPLAAGTSRSVAVQAFALLGALLAVGVVVVVGRVGPAVPAATMVLAGVAVGAFANAACAYLMYVHGDQLLVIYAWLLGGFNVAGWDDVRVMLAPLGLSVLAMLLGSRTLDVLQFGDEQAATLGVRVARARLLLTCAATLAAAVAVSVAGLIGFVGLVVPHVARMLIGPGHRRLLPFSALLGGAFLIAADAVARGLPGPTEVPVGVVTAAVGGPFFLALLHRARRGSPW